MASVIKLAFQLLFSPANHINFRKTILMQPFLKSLVINRSSTGTYYTAVNDINQVAHNYFDSRMFRFTVKYKFGNDQLKTSQHQAGNQEEAGRIK